MRKRRLYRARVKNYLIISTIVCGVLFLLTISSAGAYEIELPPHYGLTVKFIGTATETYSNNITFAEDDKNKIEDFVTSLSLGLDLRLEGKRRNMGLTGRINRQVRTGSVDSINASENLSANFSTAFSEYDSISFNNSFSHTQVPETFAEAFGRLRGRLNLYNINTNLQYNREISKYFNFGTTYSYRQNWSDEEGTTDSHRNNIGLTASYNHSERINFPLSYSYADSSSGEGERIYIQTMSAGMGVRITEYLSIGTNYGANISSIKSKRTTNENLDFSLVLSKEYLIDRKSTARIHYSRGVNITPDRDEIFNNWKVTADLHRDFLKDLSGNLSSFYGEGKFVSEGVTDKLLGASIGLNYKIWEHKSGANMNANLGYTYSELNSTDENRGYARSTINGGVTAGF